MILKIPIYVDFESKGFDSSFIPEAVRLIQERCYKVLEEKTPKNIKHLTLEEEDDEGNIRKIKFPFEFISPEEAINQFR